MENADFVCMTSRVLASRRRRTDLWKEIAPHNLVILPIWCVVIVIVSLLSGQASDLQIFLMALSLWDRRPLCLAHWPCYMSGPKGANRVWENQFVSGTGVKLKTQHVQALDYTGLNLLFSPELEFEHVEKRPVIGLKVANSVPNVIYVIWSKCLEHGVCLKLKLLLSCKFPTWSPSLHFESQTTEYSRFFIRHNNIFCRVRSSNYTL